jgi:ABC-2 type transport system ATP-binding protein
MIEAKNLSKWYGAKRAVNDITFSVEKGEVLGFLGPNGAGKSTTMRMITGYLRIDGGSISIGGHDIEENPLAAKAVMGYLPENAPLYDDMTVSGFLHYMAKLRGLPDRHGKVGEAIETCFLEKVAGQPIHTLSKGYRHRTCFAQSILHDPDVLVMDEPTDGLDPNQKHEVRNLIKRMGERKAIIISTHILEEVDAVCSRVIIVNNGELVANELPADLKQRSPLHGTVTIAIAGKGFAEISDRLNDVSDVSKVLCMSEENGLCRVRAFPTADTSDLSAKLQDAISRSGWKISELHTEEGRLDDVFRSITTSEGQAK